MSVRPVGKERSLDVLLYALVAPAVLVLIAGMQFYLVKTHSLTPWKGGGFGMFSTVDTRGARFLRCYLVTAAGEFPVEVPPGMEALAREVRSIPTRGRLGRITAQLAQATWVPYGYDGGQSPPQGDATPLQTDQGGLVGGETMDRIGPTFPADEQPSDYADADSPYRTQPRFRALDEFEPDPLPGIALPVIGVRVELWRYRYGVATAQVTAHKMAEVTATAPEVRE